ncbi:B12-binding domain-containing radical SAM protein [Candidatus Omnitrophota bacterium]
MKIVLIAPSYAEIYGSFRSALKVGFLNPPLGLCYLAACLQKEGHEVKIIDAEAQNCNLEDILRQTKAQAPGLVGITATSPEFANAALIAKALKDTLDVPIAIGGAHLSISGEEILRENPCFDFGVAGEAEQTISELVSALEADNKDYSGIRGLIYRLENRALRTDPREPPDDLDAIPFPSRSLLDNRKYFRSIPKKGYVTTTAFVSSRGCPYHCIYCAIDRIPGANRIRYRSPENVLEEIELIVNGMGIRHISFSDDILTLNKARIFKICEGIIKRRLKFTWEGLSRADAVDEELLSIMKRAGFVRISFGIESGSPEILKMIRKNETHEQIRRAFRLARKAGIIARGSIIIGLPYENKGKVEETVRFIKQLYGLDQIFVNICTPYPGTKLREMILSGEGGSRLIDRDISALRRFGNAVIEVNDLTKNDLINLQKKILLLFYFHPGKILHSLSTYELKAFFQDGLNFILSLLNNDKAKTGI